MLTRDIDLYACILDLVDNSIHSLVRRYDIDVMGYLKGMTVKRPPRAANISIRFSGTSFSITDTCGGITVQEAREQVFRMGYCKGDSKHTGLGIYGIGMKRAFFKLGRQILVESRTKTEAFRISIYVDKWKKAKGT